MTSSDQAPSTAPKPYERHLGRLAIYDSYKRSPYLSSKHSTYFQVYSHLLEKFRNSEFVFVEVGVLNGGSLFMWRDYFGPKARIIGIDLNPDAKRWEKEGFEIHIGSQADPHFWERFFQSVGQIDVLLDDGGHTFDQQIQTAHSSIPHIRDGGLLVVEDTHTSYFEEYGHPTRFSFMEWTKAMVDEINARFPRVKGPGLAHGDSVFSISIFESIVCFHIDRAKCFKSEPTFNDGASLDAQDYRYKNSPVEEIYVANRRLSERFSFLKRVPLVRPLKNLAFVAYRRHVIKKRLKKLASFFGEA